MNILLFVVIVIAANCLSVTNSDHTLTEWDTFKAQYGKSYKTPEEEYFRMRIFMENKREIMIHNLKYKAGEVSYEMGINQFSDMDSDEFNEIYNGYNKDSRMKNKVGKSSVVPDIEGKPFVTKKKNELPDYVNWIEKNAVTPVRDQKNCGSCYAFASLGALESRQYIHNKAKLTQLSVQNIIDCSSKQGNNGCDGGLARKTYMYIKENKGVNNETSYPYEGREGKCRFHSKNQVTTLKGFFSIGKFEEDELKEAVASGPVAASMDASLSSFHKYKGGIYQDDDCDPMRLTHAVLLVGYGTDSKTKEKYWLVKNSYGVSWGEKGYFKIIRNDTNMCGIATRAVFPDV